MSVAGGIPIRMGVVSVGVICDTPNTPQSLLPHGAHDQRISKLLFRTSCIWGSCQPLGVVSRGPAEPRTTKPHGGGDPPGIGLKTSKSGHSTPTAVRRESGALTDR